MIKQISTTLGSKPILTQIKNKYPDRHMIIYESLNESNVLMLLDPSGQETVFKTPIIFDVTNHGGHDEWQSFINFTPYSIK